MLDYRVFGKVAHVYGGRVLRCRVCKSAAGWYIGTYDHDGSAYSRESVEYWQDEGQAEFHMGLRLWTQRENP